MATVGLNFGSLTAGTGFDVPSTVTSILAIEQAIETPWKTQTTALQAQDTALSTVGSDLSALSTAVTSLTDFQGVLASKLGSSSNTNVLSLSSAGASAVAGSHTVVVTSLATTSSDYSDRVVNAADLLNGSLGINVGGTTTTSNGTTTTTGGTNTTVTIPAGGETLQGLAAQINLGAYGVTASVVTDTAGSRLSLVSKTAGTAGQLALTSSVADTTNSNTAIAFTQGQPGADAVLSVDGLSTTSASNTVTGAIPGVTFQLLSAAPSSPIQIQITNDNGSVSTAFQSLVKAYNTVVADVKTQESTNSSGVPNPLFGSTVLSAIQTQLSQSLLGGAPSGAIKSVTQLGLTLGQDGTLTLDSNALTSALNTSFTDITGFLQNAGSFGQTFSKTLDTLGSTSVTGNIYLAKQQNAAQEKSLATNIANEETRIAAQKITLTAELNAANQILQGLPSQINQVNEIYSAVTGYNTTPTG